MKSNISNGIVWLSISQVIFVLSAYTINIILGRHLGPSEYGIYGIVISIMSVVNLIQTSGLPQAVSKQISEDENNSSAILKSGIELQIISTILLTIIFSLSSNLIAIILQDHQLTPYLRLSALIYPAYAIFALYTGFYNGLHKFKKQASINIIYSAVKTLTVLGLGYYFSINGAIIGFILAPLVAFLIGLQLPKKNEKRFSYMKLVKFSLPLIGFSFFITFLQSVDLYFIKSLLSSNELAGFYTANQNIARIPFYALGAFSTVLFPSISKSVSANDHTKTRIMISTSLRYVLILLIPATLIISGSSKEIINLLYSYKYLSAAPSLSVLIFSSAFLTVFLIMANIINGSGHPWESFIYSIIGVIVSTIFCLILIPKYNLAGAAIATGLGGAFAMLLSLYSVYKRFSVSISFTYLFKIIISSLPVYFLVLKFGVPPLMLPELYLLAFLTYFILLYLIKGVTNTDINLFLNLLPFRRFKK